MNNVFTVALPLFAMIFLGFIIVRLGLIDKNATKGLVTVVFWIFLPFFIFIKTINAQFNNGLDWNLLIAYYLPCIFIFFIISIGGKLYWKGNLQTAFLRGLITISGVVGYMGLPLLIMIFGDKAILPTVMITMADNLIILAGGTLLMELSTPRITEARKENILKISFTISMSIIKNPLFISVFLAVLYLGLNLTLPNPIRIFATQMTDATGPLALVALGAALGTHRNPTWYNPEILILAGSKIIILPILVFISSYYIFNLDVFLVKISVLMASLPVAVNVYILASRYKTYEAESSFVMFTSALLSIVTISCLLIFLE